MSDLEKAARMALEALGWYERETHEKAITALRQALKQPAKRPWQQIECPVCGELARAAPVNNPVGALGMPVNVPVTAPKALVDWEAIAADQAMTIAMMKAERKPWVGLTLDEKHALNDALNLNGRFAVIDTIEAKLKVKNT